MRTPSGLVLLAIFMALALYMVFVFPGAWGFGVAAPPGAFSFDTRCLAPAGESIAGAAVMEPGARRAAIIGHWTFDLAYPALYGAFFAASWRWALRRLGAGAARANLAAGLTLAAPVFDLAENAGIAVLLSSVGSAASPADAEARARAAASLIEAATPAKWVAVGLVSAGTAVLFGLVAEKRLSNRKRRVV